MNNTPEVIFQSGLVGSLVASYLLPLVKQDGGDVGPCDVRPESALAISSLQDAGACLLEYVVGKSCSVS